MIERSYWWETVAAECPGVATVPPGRVDVAIVGGGYTGLSAARQLARAGASVVVLERERIGWGASSRNGGQVLTGLKLDPATLVARLGEPHARRLFQASIESIGELERVIAEEAIACEYERSGHLQAAAKPSHFEAFREEQALLGRVFDHPVRLVSRDDQRTELGTDAYFGLLVDDRSAALNPAQYVRGLAAAAARAGAVLVEHAAVERMVHRASRWAVIMRGGEVDAGEVLVATNGYADRAFPPLQRRLVPIGSYIIATEPLSAEQAASVLPRRRMAFNSKHFLHYFRLTDDRRLLLGGRVEFARSTPDTTRRAAAVLRRGLVRLFPELAEARIDYAWGGNVAFTRDQLPHAGRLEDAYYAGGYCGHGVAMATSLGALVARRMAGEAIEHPLVGDSFPPIPLYRGNPWFLPAIGLYYRVKDWLE